MRPDVSPLDTFNSPLEEEPSFQQLWQRLETIELPLQQVPVRRGAEVQTGTGGLSRESAERLFPNARSPRGALAGALLLAGHWSDAHDLANSLASPEGAYWHALIHRMEPDTWNSDYWFGRTGAHAIFPAVLAAARRFAGQQPEARLRLDAEWNPAVFNAWCDQARANPAAPRSVVIASIHSAECHLLWRYCRENRVG